jgi:lantibiotic modifying enzyme
MVPLVTEDILCDEEVIVPANSTLEEAVVARVEWVCSINKLTNELSNIIEQVQEQIETLTECCQENTQTNLEQDEQIADLEQCCKDNTETNELQNVQLEDLASQIDLLQAQINNITSNNYKYVHETTSVFDGDSVQISRIDLEDCGLLPLACSTVPGFVDKVCDLHVSVYYFFTGTWIKIPTYVSGAEGYQLAIDATTGVLTIIFAIPPVSPAVPVRIVILA